MNISSTLPRRPRSTLGSSSEPAAMHALSKSCSTAMRATGSLDSLIVWSVVTMWWLALSSRVIGMWPMPDSSFPAMRFFIILRMCGEMTLVTMAGEVTSLSENFTSWIFSLSTLLMNVSSSFCSVALSSLSFFSTFSGGSRSSSKSRSEESTETNLKSLKPSMELTTNSSISSYMRITFLPRWRNCSMYGEDMPVSRLGQQK
mmetsp:Transcript_14779/g.44397  ORF Transcript_14779/g.44397 Transcript_14779/m.44397 type:complete len:202 (-) Transcript_14779:1529-2134(-)